MAPLGALLGVPPLGGCGEGQWVEGVMYGAFGSMSLTSEYRCADGRVIVEVNSPEGGFFTIDGVLTPLTLGMEPDGPIYSRGTEWIGERVIWDGYRTRDLGTGRLIDLDPEGQPINPRGSPAGACRDCRPGADAAGWPHSP